MLDQNTDRMWYVIGAVIVGAAIILIMNNVFPQLFASVGETFKDKTEASTIVTDGIMPVQKGDGVNLLQNPQFDENISNELMLRYGVNEAPNGVWIGTNTEDHWATRIEKSRVFTADEVGMYTYSIKAKIDTSVNELLWMRHEGAMIVGREAYEGIDYRGNIQGKGNPVDKQLIKQGEWAIYSTTFKVTEPGTVRIRGYMPFMSLGDTVQVDWEKLETGTVATPI